MLPLFIHYASSNFIYYIYIFTMCTSPYFQYFRRNYWRYQRQKYEILAYLSDRVSVQLCHPVAEYNHPIVSPLSKWRIKNIILLYQLPNCALLLNISSIIVLDVNIIFYSLHTYICNNNVYLKMILVFGYGVLL